MKTSFNNKLKFAGLLDKTTFLSNEEYGVLNTCDNLGHAVINPTLY